MALRPREPEEISYFYPNRANFNPFHHQLSSTGSGQSEYDTTTLHDIPMFDDPTTFSSSAEAGHGYAPDNQPPKPQFIQPLQLQSSPSPPPPPPSMATSPSSSSLETPSPLLDSFVISSRNVVDISDPRFRRLSLTTLDLAAADEAEERYRPRDSTPRSSSSSTTTTRTRKRTYSSGAGPGSGAGARITPRSEKHARELDLNRKAATKCRTRQKAYVEGLQTRCRTEEERLRAQMELVHALRDEVLALRSEVLRHSLYGCRSLRYPAMLLPGAAGLT